MKKKQTLKEKIIAKISAIIKEIGNSVTTQDLQLDSSPIHKSAGKTCILIERFSENDVDIVTYVNDVETNEDCIPYEEVSTANLKGILEHLKEYKQNYDVDFEKTLKRCSN